MLLAPDTLSGASSAVRASDWGAPHGAWPLKAAKVGARGYRNLTLD